MSEPDNNTYLTLYVDLLATELDDFIEHALPIVQYIAELGLVDKEEGEWREGESQPELHPNTKTTHWDFGAVPHITRVAVSVTRKGITSCDWFGLYLYQGVHPYHKPKGGKILFDLQAIHYRRDRLNVAMWETGGRETVLGNHLMDWLMKNWRDKEKGGGVDDLMKAGAQMPDSPKNQHPSLVTGEVGRPPDPLYDKMYEELRTDPDWQKSDAGKFKQVYDWWLGEMKKKPAKALKKRFKDAMLSRARRDQAQK